MAFGVSPHIALPLTCDPLRGRPEGAMLRDRAASALTARQRHAPEGPAAGAMPRRLSRTGTIDGSGQRGSSKRASASPQHSRLLPHLRCPGRAPPLRSSPGGVQVGRNVKSRQPSLRWPSHAEQLRAPPLSRLQVAAGATQQPGCPATTPSCSPAVRSRAARVNQRRWAIGAAAPGARTGAGRRPERNAPDSIVRGVPSRRRRRPLPRPSRRAWPYRRFAKSDCSHAVVLDWTSSPACPCLQSR